MRLRSSVTSLYSTLSQCYKEPRSPLIKLLLLTRLTINISLFSFVSGAVKSGINAINRIHGMSGILKAFSTVSGQILDAAGLNFGKDLRDMNVSP